MHTAILVMNAVVVAAEAASMGNITVIDTSTNVSNECVLMIKQVNVKTGPADSSPGIATSIDLFFAWAPESVAANSTNATSLLPGVNKVTYFLNNTLGATTYYTTPNVFVRKSRYGLMWHAHLPFNDAFTLSTYIIV